MKKKLGLLKKITQIDLESKRHVGFEPINLN